MTDHKQNKPRKPISDVRGRPALDEVWPVHSAGGWPQSVSLGRGCIYEGRT